MKKIIIILSVAVAIILVVVVFILSPFIIQKDIQKTINVNFSEVDKITISSGNTGKTYDIVGKDNIREFLNIFNGVKLKKDFDQRIHKGYIFTTTLYKSGKLMGGFDFGYNQIDVSKDNKLTRYISNKNIDDVQISEIAKKYSLS